MDVGVLVKAALDVNVLRSDPTGRVAVENIPLVISEYDRNAIYEAVKIRDNTGGGKVYVYSVLTWGPMERKLKDFENVIREALALGGDEAYVVADRSINYSEPRYTARVLEYLIRSKGNPKLVLTGEASTDMTSATLSPYLAARLGYNIVSFAKKIEVGNGYLTVLRDADDRLERVRVSLPAIVSVTGEINSPRLPTLIQIRRAFRKPLEKYSLADIGLKPFLSRYEGYQVVTIKRKNIFIEEDSLEKAADKLIDYLVEEGVVKI